MGKVLHTKNQKHRIPTTKIFSFMYSNLNKTKHKESLSFIFWYFWITLFAISHHRMLYKLHRKKGCNLAALAVGCFANCIINYCCVQLKDHLCPATLSVFVHFRFLSFFWISHGDFQHRINFFVKSQHSVLKFFNLTIFF